MHTLTLKAGFAYFLIVFAAGFVLGAVRVLLVVPRVGTRVAKLAEVPIMLVVTILAARWIVRRFHLPPRITPRLGVGLSALALMLVMEIGVVLWLQGVTLAQYVANRDPVAGVIYVVMLVVFALMPALVSPARPTSPPAPTR
jgi:hypothetical protein